MKESRIRQIIKEETVRVLKEAGMEDMSGRVITHPLVITDLDDKEYLDATMRAIEAAGFDEMKVVLNGSEDQWRRLIKAADREIGGGAFDDLYAELGMKVGYEDEEDEY